MTIKISVKIGDEIMHFEADENTSIVVSENNKVIKRSGSKELIQEHLKILYKRKTN